MTSLLRKRRAENQPFAQAQKGKKAALHEKSTTDKEIRLL
jgi:hypothetical protein